VKSAVKVASKREPYALLALVAMVGTLIWIVWPEDGKIGAQNLKLWTLFVLGSAMLLFAPITRRVFRLSDERAWQFAVGGASGLGFSWVAFLLPSINSNQAFFGTIATAAAALAAWTAPGRPT
jgi:peptidoglycan/LPS O-acetylase OafA/YrhL